jgi:uncharacterized cupredoxin-like copper-binding protein
VTFHRLIALLALAALPLAAGACGGSASANATTVTIHFSRFEPALITARAGEPITITLDNADPIAHEWIVGTEDVHQRHRTGTEPFHDSVPTEVTIPALSTRVTTVTFDEPGDYQYICHLPGHEQYGMVGVLRVLPD